MRAAACVNVYLIEDEPVTLVDPVLNSGTVTQGYLTLSDVLWHLDLLVNERRADEVDRDGASAPGSR